MINFDGMIVSNDVIEVKQLKISPFALKSILHSMNFCNFCFGYDLNMAKNMTIFSLPMIIPVFFNGKLSNAITYDIIMHKLNFFEVYNFNQVLPGVCNVIQRRLMREGELINTFYL